MAIGYAGPQHAGWGLDSEHGKAAYFSALVLLSAAGLALLVARTWPSPPRASALPLYGFGALLTWMALDEALVIHEAFEERLGVDWQLIYAPLALVGAVFGLLTAVRLRRRRPALLLLLAGGGLWAASQLFEYLQWGGDDDVLVHPWMIYYEELFEVAGTGLIAIAMLDALRVARRGAAGRT